MPKTSSLEVYDNEPSAVTMSPNHQRIADQLTSESPRSSDVTAATAAAAGLSPRSASQASSDPSIATIGSGNEPLAAKSERRLVFADESGRALVEMHYSSRTHYSKQASSGALPTGRGCCVIS